MDGEDVLLIFIKGMMILVVILIAFLLIVATIEHPATMFIVIGCVAFIFGLGAIAHFVEWSFFRDDIKSFFRNAKRIKIEWGKDEDSKV